MSRSGSRPTVDDRGVSELMAVATLVGLALILVVGIGISVFLFAPDESGEPEGEFTFRHVEQADALMITYEEGDPIISDDLSVEGESGNATWTALAGWEQSREVEPGDSVQAGEDGAYGASIGSSDRISVVWRNATVNGTATLAEWNAESAL